ncbi:MULTISPECIES: serine hydrolase [unclassified Caballeronia]|uniref:serine hydrolase domain-containing protein n=1 Tax=unclassified Caballeronia TaxID=2646786 RepID=UPI002027AAB1|nr:MULTISPECIES: serine hydrolase [unclassified Caballeronia]
MFKRTFALLLTACATLPATAQQPADDSAAIRQVVDTYLQPLLTSHQAAGAIVGVSLRGKRYYYAYGTANDDGSPFTADTIVEIGSCTKVFTTTLFALAAARHQIEPDAPMQRYMPNGVTLQPAAQNVTPLQLADFSSGMPDNPPDAPRDLRYRGIDHYTSADFFRWVSSWSPDGPLPRPYEYSNAGIGVLGAMLANATGRAWNEQLSADILQPLGMTSSFVGPVDVPGRTAEGHLRNGQRAPQWPLYAWYAAGAMRSTAADMLRFGEANLGHSEIDGHPVSAELIAAMRDAQKPRYTLPNGVAQQGMAWVTNNGNGSPGLHPEILKNGGTAGFSSVIVVNPFKDAAIFIAVNQNDTPPAPVAVAIGRHLR